MRVEKDPLQLPNLEAMLGAQTEARTGTMGTTPGPAGAEEKVAAREITSENNPATSWREQMLRERGERIAMNTPERKLEVNQIEGYHLHWFVTSNIPRAIRAWYEFVLPHEVELNDRSIGGRDPGVGSHDLGGGGRVTQIAGIGADGKPEELVLMKCRNELYFEDQRKIADRNLSIIKQIFHKKAPQPIRATEVGETERDYDMRYTREAVIDMSNGRFVKEA